MARPVVADLSREILRREWALVLGIVVGLTTLLAFGAAEDHGLFLQVVCLLIPLVWLPVGARMAARDRDSQLVLLHPTSGFSKPRWFASRVLSGLFLVVAAWISTTLIALGVLGPAGDSAISANRAWLAWSLIIGVCSLAAGLLIGILAVKRVVAAISYAFGLIIVWVVAATESRTFLQIGESLHAADLTSRLLHLSPLVWAQDDLGSLTPVFAERTPGISLAVVATSSVLLIACAFATWLWYQGHDHWSSAPKRRYWLASLLLAAVLLTTLTPFDVAPPTADVLSSTQSTFRVDYQGLGVVPAPGMPLQLWRPWRTGDEVMLAVEIEALPGEMFEVTNVSVRSPHVRFAPAEDVDKSVTVPEDRSRAVYQAKFRVNVEYFGGPMPVDIDLKVNGEDFSLSGWVLARSPPSNGMLILAASGSAFLVLILPRRWALRRQSAW